MMSAEVQGTLTFVSNGTPAAMMERVQAMVAELVQLGATPRVTVTVDLTSQLSSGAITAETVTSAPAAPSISTQMAPMPRSTERPSLTGDGDGDGVVSGASMGTGEVADFLGGAPGVDWGVTGLTSLANQARLSLNGGEMTWRKVAKAVRLELLQAVLAQPTESGLPMTTVEFDRRRPAWMSKAGNLLGMFGVRWSELPGLRLDV